MAQVKFIKQVAGRLTEENSATDSLQLLSLGVGAASTGNTGYINFTGRLDSSAHANNVGLKVPTNAGTPSPVTGQLAGDLVFDTSKFFINVYNGTNFYQSLTYLEGNVTTTNNTTTTALSVTLANNTVYLAQALVVARRTDAADRAVYIRNAAVYREAAGAATIQGVVDAQLTRESDGTWDCTLDTSGNTIRVRVQGNTAKTIDWRVYLRLIPVT